MPDSVFLVDVVIAGVFAYYGGAVGFFLSVAILVRIIVTALIIIITVRIPFKRTYHWMFLALSVVTLLFTLGSYYFELSPDPAVAYARVWTLFVFGTRVQDVFFLQFVVFFVARKVKLWHKLAIATGYAYVTATIWVPLAIGDIPFVYGSAILTPTGWSAHPATSDPYLRPSGIDVFTVVMMLLTFGLLIQHYRLEKSPLVRGQTKYMILGNVFLASSNLAVGIFRDLALTTLPNPQQSLGAVSDLVLLLGLRRKGFYSVTPIAETSTASASIRYPLQDGHSYLAQDPKSAFEAFSEHVRAGREGLIITRIFPADVRKDYGLQTTPIRWLAESTGEDTIPPGDLLGLSLAVKNFMEKATNPVVMLHGIEYLTTYDGFSPVLRLIQSLSEQNATRRGVLILPVLPDALNKQDEVLLVSETTPLPKPAAE